MDILLKIDRTTQDR